MLVLRQIDVCDCRADDEMSAYPVRIRPELLKRCEDYLALVGIEPQLNVKCEPGTSKSLLVRTQII